MAKRTPKLARQLDQALGTDQTDAVPSEAAPLDTSLPRVRGRLSYDQIALIVSMNAAGEPTQAIADYFQIRRETLWKILQKFADTSAEAKARLKMSASRLADAAILAADRGAQRGDGSVALELLDRLDVAPKRMAAQAGTSGVQVIVVVGNGNPAALPDFGALELPEAPDDAIDIDALEAQGTGSADSSGATALPTLAHSTETPS